jgi:hypothetical protein
VTLNPKVRVRLPARAPACCVSERQGVSLVYLTCQLLVGNSSRSAFGSLFDSLRFENQAPELRRTYAAFN